MYFVWTDAVGRVDCSGSSRSVLCDGLISGPDGGQGTGWSTFRLTHLHGFDSRSVCIPRSFLAFGLDSIKNRNDPHENERRIVGICYKSMLEIGCEVMAQVMAYVLRLLNYFLSPL